MVARMQASTHGARWFGLVLMLATGCAAPGPGPMGPPPGPGPGDMPPVEGAPTDPEIPIDPAKEMPEASLSTTASLELGKPAMVVVDGRADIFSSGLAAPDQGRGGRLPATLALAPGGGSVTFGKVKGVVGCVAGATTPPDGGDCAGGNTDIVPANGISGIKNHQHSQFLVGVFLGPTASTQAPATLDFSTDAKGEQFPELAPVIGQQFYIGDGLTSAGASQRFVVPAGATRLFLAFSDAFGFQGEPGAYGDNTGGLHVTLTQQK